MSSLAHDPLVVVYDPLCGWCYGATPAIRRLQQVTPLKLVPSGLFAGAGARPMDAGFAEHAWANDRRIQQLTQQPFSARYRERVLGVRTGRLDSGPALSALTAAWQVDPAHELPLLEAIQSARYVDGRDVTDSAVLAELLRGLGYGVAAERFEKQRVELDAAAAARMRQGQEVLRSVGARGVPTLVARQGATARVIPSDVLYAPADTQLASFREALSNHHHD